MADTKKTAAETQAAAEEQQKLDILARIVDPETRTCTLQKTLTIGGKNRDVTLRFRYPTIADRVRQGVLQARVLGGVPVEQVDITTYGIAYIKSFLESLLAERPAWFTFDSMESIKQLEEIYEEVNLFVDSFRTAGETPSDAGDSKAAAGKKAVANG